MASIPASYLIGVGVDLDATDLESGTDQAEQAFTDLSAAIERESEDAEIAIERLADEVDTASDDMRRSLDSINDGTASVGDAFDRMSTDVEDEGGRMSEVGTEIGAEFSSNLAEGISSGDASATVTDSATGLFATLGALGPTAAVAGVGGLLATGLVKGIVDGMSNRRQAVIDSVNEVLSGVLNSTDNAAKAIRDSLLDAFSLESRLTNLGGGDLSKGVQIAEETARDLNVSINTIYDALSGEVNPATDKLVDKLVEAQEEGTALHGTFFNSSLLMDETAENADDLHKQIVDTRLGMQDARDAAQGLNGWMEKNKALAGDTATHTKNSADAADRYAAALERAAAAADRINDRAELNGTADKVS